MNTSKYLNLNLMGENDDADISKVSENFETLDEAAQTWSNLSNTGTVLETETDFQIATVLPVMGDIFAVTVKMPRTYAEGDTVTVGGVAYTLYQGTDPALSDAWKAGEVVTINFDTVSRRCWASAGGGAPRPLPPQISNLQGSTPDGETPTIIWTWTNPVDENFAGMVLIVKEGSSPNGVADGTQVYKGTGTTFTQTEGVVWDRTYYARGFAYNSQEAYQMDATGAIASATPSDVPNQVTDVVLTPNKSRATLTWTNPTQQSYSTTKVIQKIGSAPENPNDGTVVYDGTGTTVTVENLQDSIQYYFAIYAIANNGKYKDAIVKDYTPKIYPVYDFTGQHMLIKDGGEDWRIKFLSSGTLTWNDEDAEIDVFLVGGGAGGGTGTNAFFGGGGGYTATHKKIKITKGQTIQVTIGAGGQSSQNGGSTTFFDLTVSGGRSQNSYGAGGSGGGGYGSQIHPGGAGGSDGGNGGNSWGNGGKGQGTTTREFGEPDGDLYSGGGAGAGANGSVSGGQGTPVLAKSGSDGDYAGTRIYGGQPGGGYGGGGGGGDTDYGTGGGTGAQGIAIIRNTREVA